MIHLEIHGLAHDSEMYDSQYSKMGAFNNGMQYKLCYHDMDTMQATKDMM